MKTTKIKTTNKRALNDLPRNPAQYYRGQGWKGWGDFLRTPGMPVFDANVPATVLAAVKPALGDDPAARAQLERMAACLPGDLRTAAPILRQFTAALYMRLLAELYADPEKWWERDTVLDCLNGLLLEIPDVIAFTPILGVAWAQAVAAREAV